LQEVGYAELLVSDTGHGMSEETRSRLFEPFFTTKLDSEGTGLGLTIVYAIVQNCAGHIYVDSRADRGTTFRVYFPLLESEALSDLDTELSLDLPRDEGAGEGSACPVCLVDDDETYRTLLARSLRRAGYLVLTASSGTDALRVIADARRAPAVVITDVQMPGIDGVELARRLRKIQPQLKLILISGKPDCVDTDELCELGARLLAKPFSVDTLLQEIDLMLDEVDPPSISSVLRAAGGA